MEIGRYCASVGIITHINGGLPRHFFDAVKIIGEILPDFSVREAVLLEGSQDDISLKFLESFRKAEGNIFRLSSETFYNACGAYIFLGSDSILPGMLSCFAGDLSKKLKAFGILEVSSGSIDEIVESYSKIIPDIPLISSVKPEELVASVAQKIIWD